MKVLVVEDNQKIAKYLATALQDESYIVDVVYDGLAAERMMALGGYDLVILDVMLPGKDGVAVCQDARRAGNMVPILMLTARADVSDRVLGLDSGADDYMMKPFVLDELLARIRSLLRRPVAMVAEVIQVGAISLDTAEHMVYCSDHALTLTVKEYVVLEYLMRHAGTIVTREQILEHCWDFAYSAFSNIVDVYIKQLRQKLGPHYETYIQTVRGVGYRFESR